MADEKTSIQSIADLVGKERVQRAYLIVVNTKTVASIGKMFKLEGLEMILGRSADNAIQIEDDGISRKHAKVMLGPDGKFMLVDLGSTNGTYLNGHKVNARALQDGDKIQIGSNTVLKFSLQDALEEEYQRGIYESATRDDLTKLFNKKYFLDALKKEFSYCTRHRVPLSLMLFDVDHFKKVNDVYGHPCGDHVLMNIAQRVTETVRSEDVLARYGGEEFAVMLREQGADKAQVCADRCRRAVAQTPFTFNGQEIPVTISLGIATLFEGDFKTPEELIAEADRYLYKAKAGGRNRVEAKNYSGP
jgi:diguanylate cyclase (GGDEF)-like protein